MGRPKGTRKPDNRVFEPDASKVQSPESKAPETGTLPLSAAPVPKLVEYEVGGVKWRCAAFDDLMDEMENGLTPDKLPTFHEAMVARGGRCWTIVRRLFGIMPVELAPDTAIEDMRIWSRAELADNIGMELKYLREELNAARGHWMRFSKPAVQEPRSEVQSSSQAKGELELIDEQALLRQYGLQVQFESPEEKVWFMGRVSDFEKPLLDKNGQALARSVLTGELQLLRLDALLNNSKSENSGPVGSGAWKNILGLQKELQEAYTKNFDRLQKACPYVAGISGKFSFAGVMSEVTRCIQEWEANQDETLIDGILTATEIQVCCRRSVQREEPDYRLGMIVYFNMAKAGLWNPNWKPTIPHRELKKITDAFTESYIKASEGEVLPDLMKDGPEGEYPAIGAVTG